MKTNIIFSRLMLLSFVAMLLMPHDAFSQKKSKKKKDAATEVAAPKKTDGKTISELVKKSNKIEGLFTIYQDTINGSLQILISEDHLGKEFIHFHQIADGVLDAGAYRGSYRGSRIFKVEKYFDKIEFTLQNTSFYFDPENPISKAKDANTSAGMIASLKIEAHDKDKGLYLLKADDLFTQETFAQIKPPRFPGASPVSFSLGNLDKNKTKVSAIRNYPENTDVAVEYVYSSASVLNGGSDAVTDGRNVSIKVYHSLIAMPEDDYQPLFDDPRVGYFTTQVNDQTATNSVPYRDLVHRWKLVKKDPNAAISEPVEPIVWWMENTTPLEWRETIKNAVLEWNKAFEKAGFRNAVVVKMQPDDADWDAGDIRYNVLRWTSSPRAPFGGYGPSFVNPRTGQILGADIMLEFVHFTNRVFYDKLFDLTASASSEINATSNTDYNFCSAGHIMHENTMFGQALLAANNSDLEMERMKKEAMIALLMHEVGHTLGLNHNMKASQVYSIEQLSDADFIKGKALTGSVMDYADINITRDRSKQGQYYDTSVGPYDIWAIQFGYTPFKSETEKEALLSQSTKPELIFGNDADDMRSPGKAIDPRVMVGDLSSDAIGNAIERIKTVNDLLPTVKDKFSNDGESYQELRRVYYLLTGQYANATNVISRYIGGVYVDRAMVGQNGATQPYTSVSLADQKRAMAALSNFAFSPDAYKAPSDLYNYLAMQRRGFNFSSGTEDPKIHDQVLNYQKNVLNHLLHPNTVQRISDSELYGNQYSLSDFMTDLNTAIFKADIAGNVNSFRQNLQLEYTNMLIGALTGNQASRYSNAAKSMCLYNLTSIKSMLNTTGNMSSRAHKQHLRTLIDNALKEIK